MSAHLCDPKLPRPLPLTSSPSLQVFRRSRSRPVAVKRDGFWCRLPRQLHRHVQQIWHLLSAKPNQCSWRLQHSHSGCHVSIQPGWWLPNAGPWQRVCGCPDTGSATLYAGRTDASFWCASQYCPTRRWLPRTCAGVSCRLHCWEKQRAGHSLMVCLCLLCSNNPFMKCKSPCRGAVDQMAMHWDSLSV